MALSIETRSNNLISRRKPCKTKALFIYLLLLLTDQKGLENVLSNAWFSSIFNNID